MTMGFSEKVADQALVACGRCCCICHKFCGTKIELHHIQQRAFGGDDTFENCIPLCFECHADMGKTDTMHPKGRQYSKNELTNHRDKWYEYIAGGDWRSHVNLPVSGEDSSLFKEICLFFSDNIQGWMRDGDMFGTYPKDVFNPLAELLYKAKFPFFEFLNPGLESLKRDLLGAVERFWEYLAANTFRAGDATYMNAPRIWLLEHYYLEAEEKEDSDSRARRYAQYYQEAETLSDLLDSLWNQYCIFIRRGRRIIFEGTNS